MSHHAGPLQKTFACQDFPLRNLLAARIEEMEKKHLAAFIYSYGPQMTDALAARGITNLDALASLSETDIMGFPECMQTATRLMKDRLCRLLAAYREQCGLHLLSAAASWCPPNGIQNK